MIDADDSGRDWKEKAQCLKIAKKSRIQLCERSELRLHLSGQKLMKNGKNNTWSLRSNRSILNGQKLLENATIKKFKWDILVIFKHCELS